MRRRVVGLVSLGVLALSAWPALAQEKLTVWFSKGFYRSEDESLWATIKKFEDKTGIKVELSQYAIQDMIPKTVAALDSGSPPDVGYADTYNNQAAGKWASEGKLEDLTDILKPMMDRFAPQTVEHMLLMNEGTKRKAYYGFPMKRQTLHTEIWGDMLERAGFKPGDVPKTWKEYWSFWCDKVQPAYRKATSSRVYGIGAPMGVESTDSFQSFYAFMDAYDAKLVDDDGKLLLDNPNLRANLIKALTDYVEPHQKGCVPPSATTWKDPDNNVAFHNRTTVMTHNFTISIAAKWYEDSVNPNNTAEQRAAAKKAYEETIITAPFPARPDGKPMTYRADVKHGVVFSGAKNKDAAKKFVQFIMEEDNLRPYVEGALGRWFPVTKASVESPFWQADKHRKAVYEQFRSGTEPFDFVKNYRFTLLNNENVFAKAMNRVVSEKVPVEKAVDELLARVRQVATAP